MFAYDIWRGVGLESYTYLDAGFLSLSISFSFCYKLCIIVCRQVNNLISDGVKTTMVCLCTWDPQVFMNKTRSLILIFIKSIVLVSKIWQTIAFFPCCMYDFVLYWLVLARMWSCYYSYCWFSTIKFLFIRYCFFFYLM